MYFERIIVDFLARILNNIYLSFHSGISFTSESSWKYGLFLIQ